MTNFTDNPEKIGRNSNRRKSRNMADAGNEDPQHQQPEEHQENETGDENTTAPTEMYLPDLDNTPISQALKNGLDWGMEDEVMVECPNPDPAHPWSHQAQAVTTQPNHQTSTILQTTNQYLHIQHNPSPIRWQGMG